MILLKIFISGVIFLLLAIAVNIAASSLKLTGWYEYLLNIQKLGLAKAFGQLTPTSILWLFVGYPLCLGFIVYLLRNLIK